MLRFCGCYADPHARDRNLPGALPSDRTIEPGAPTIETDQRHAKILWLLRRPHVCNRDPPGALPSDQTIEPGAPTIEPDPNPTDGI
jgi:hypothetical protein